MVFKFIEVKKDKNGLIVLFTTPKLPDFYEILTLGDGSCFYYSIEKINCEYHLKRKLNYLKKELKEIFQDNGKLIEKYLSIFPKEIDNCFINNIKFEESLDNNIKGRIINAYKGYINNHIGLGIELYEVMKELREMKIKAFIHILPLPKKKLEWIINEMNLSEEDINLYDYKLQKDIKMYKEEELKTNDEILHILLRREHYSRLIEKQKISFLENFCRKNKIELKIIDLPD